MKKIIFLLILLSVYQNINSQKFQDTIPFRNSLGLIVIPISFNGEIKQFAFDTGARYSVAYSWAKDELKRTNKTLTINSSSGLKSKMRFYKSGKIELGSRKIKKHLILNTPKNDVFSCHNIDGILGVDILKEFNWTINYKEKRLIMYPANFFPKKTETSHKMEFTFHKGRPYVFLKIKSKKLKFLLDTGAGGSSNISKKDYNLTGLDKYEKITMHSGSFDVNGILTKNKPTIFQLQNTVSNNVTLSPTILYNNQKSSKIGNQLWQNHELFLSLKKDLLYVSDTTITQSFESFPCSVIFYDGKMRIIRIKEGSKIWNMGIRQGDAILLFDGKSFQNFCDLDKHQRMVSKTKNTFDLTLLNGEKVTITKSYSLEN